MSERDLDLVVFGATGVTGRRVASYLAARASEGGLRWGAAARDPAKLGEVLEADGVKPTRTLQADVADPSSLGRMASSARAVVNLVGPYTRYGRPVIEACVASGTHYADLTGEMPFVRRTIDEFHAGAQAAGVKIVQVCGFEALPPDLSILLAAERALERWQEPLAEVEVAVAFTPPPGMPRPSDGVSGGTFQSLAAVAADPEASSITDPALLVSDMAFAAAVRRTSPIELAPHAGPDGSVIAPMTPAPFINPAVIHRTAALRLEANPDAGGPFRYREGIALTGGRLSMPARWALAGVLSGTQLGVRGLARAGAPVRARMASVLEKLGPASGFGPASDRLEGWRWRMTVSARTSGAHELQVHVDADGHPGYLTTARLIGEAGMLFAEGNSTSSVGCVTPAIALGASSAPRFERAGMRISVRD